MSCLVCTVHTLLVCRRHAAARSLCFRAVFFCNLCGSAHEQRQLLQLVGTCQGWRGSSPPAPDAHEPVSDERITNALQRVQDHLQEAMAISQKRSQRTCTEQAASRTKGNAAHVAVEAVTGPENTRAKMSRSIGGWEAVNCAIMRTLEKTEALEKHVMTVTMRAESLATTEADFFQTLLDRQEETQRNLNKLCAQMCQNRT